MSASQQPVGRTLADIAWPQWEPVDEATLLFVVQPVRERILLIRKKRGLGAGKVNAPGGRIEPGESPEQAAIREVQEELRVRPTGVRNVGLLEFQFVDRYSLRCHVFRADDIVGRPEETPEAIPLWTPLGAIPYEQMWADDRLWLPHLLEERPFHGRFIFEGDVMLDQDVQLR